MTTPGSHNDTYASTCHRMFFANYVKGVAPEKCASNDGHNVDSIDALVLPAVVAIATKHLGPEASLQKVHECVLVTRRSKAVCEYSTILSQMIWRVMNSESDLGGASESAARALRVNLSRMSLGNTVTA